jgi:hypothetical protein
MLDCQFRLVSDRCSDLAGQANHFVTVSGDVLQRSRQGAQSERLPAITMRITSGCACDAPSISSNSSTIMSAKSRALACRPIMMGTRDQKFGLQNAIDFFDVAAAQVSPNSYEHARFSPKQRSMAKLFVRSLPAEYCRGKVCW